MNEILKKRIEEASDKYSFKYLCQEHIGELELGCHYESGFIEGAAFALSHQWVKVYESLPEEYKYVIVADKYGHVEFAYIDAIRQWKGTNLLVFCWTPILKFETKDKEEER